MQVPRESLSAMSHWEHFEHAADIGVRGLGATMAEAFEQVALALTAAVTDPATVRAAETVRIECRAADRELLLVEWLNGVIYESSARGMLFGAFRVEIEGLQVRGELLGEPIDRARHEPAVEPKGATCTDLRVARLPDGTWLAQCIIDV